jgi:3'-phosphoadenosine 5'-phosphosulfate sulfotransferase (PAPS reductase)/FAD synthetase
MTRHVLGISGKDSLAASLLVKAYKPELWQRLELFTTLTGADYPETVAWLRCLPELLGKPIEFIEGDLPGAIAHRVSGDRAFLPSGRARYCTKEAKIQPFERWLGKDRATLYTGIRADEKRAGYKASEQISSVFPLVEFGFDLGRVWALILGLDEQYQPPTFYWESLHELARLAWREALPLFQTELDDHMSHAQKVILMSGRSRPNCYFCFNQRQYEIVWLREAHPQLFAQMMAYEKQDYSWKQDFPLRELTQERCDQIKWKRARAIASEVASQQFSGDADGFKSMASCGLFCGK